MTITPSSLTDYPLIFPGQVVEIVTNANLQALPTGVKVSKIKGNVITLSKSLTANLSGTLKFSGTVPVDSLLYLKIFAVPCGSNTAAPFLISSGSSSSKDSDDDRDKKEDERKFESNNSVLSVKWETSKNQKVGCYNLVARFSPAKVMNAMAFVVQPSDLRNPAVINLMTRIKSKD